MADNVSEYTKFFARFLIKIKNKDGQKIWAELKNILNLFEQRDHYSNYRYDKGKN